MQIGSISQTLASQMKSTNGTIAAGVSTLKGAMQSPEQFLQLLEQSISVKQTEKIAGEIGFIVDRRV